MGLGGVGDGAHPPVPHKHFSFLLRGLGRFSFAKEKSPKISVVRCICPCYDAPVHGPG